MIDMKVHVSMGSVDYVEKKTVETNQMLQNNLDIMIKRIEPVLKDWNDQHIQKYLQTLETMNQKIETVARTMDQIESFCKKTKTWIQQYNSDW